MIKRILGVAAVMAAAGVLLSAGPANASLKGSVMIQQVYSGLCMSSGKPAGTTADGNQLLMRTCNTGYGSQAWDFTSPGVITFAKNPALQAGWDPYGKMELMASGETFTFNAPGAPAGTFTAMDGTQTEYLMWAGVMGTPGDEPFKVTPTYNSFTCVFAILPR